MATASIRWQNTEFSSSSITLLTSLATLHSLSYVGSPSKVCQPQDRIIVCRVMSWHTAIQLCQRAWVDNVRHHLGLTTGAQPQVCKTPSISTYAVMALCSMDTIRQRPLLSRKFKAWFSGLWVSHQVHNDSTRQICISKQANKWISFLADIYTFLHISHSYLLSNKNWRKLP